MTDPTVITFTVKELLTRLDERLGHLDQKLDLRLVAMDERITHVERIQTERAHLVAEFMTVRNEVDKLKNFRARFIPVSVVVALTVIVNAVALWFAPVVGR